MRVLRLLAVLFVIFPLTLPAATWLVGPTRTYIKPSQVANLVANGDTVAIDAGLYLADVCAWTASNLVLHGVGGYARLDAQGTAAQGKAIWVISGNNTTVENIEFFHCAVPDHNGAGIRQQGDNLIIRSCYFHDNEDGLLAGDRPDSEILIEYSIFEHNGFGDGYSHNIYVNHIKKFTFRYSWSHRAVVGHELKSRAYENLIYCNRISNEDGSASREIDLPNGGKAYIIGNIIQQGLNGENSNIIGYGLEGLTNPGPQALFLVNNTIWNQKSVGSFLAFPNAPLDCKIYNNLLLGGGSLFAGNLPPTGLDTLANLRFTNLADAQLTDPQLFNFQPSCSSPAINGGVNPGTDGTQVLLPAHAYLHPASAMIRTLAGAQPDVGAYEAICNSAVQTPTRPDFLQRTGQLIFLDPNLQDASLDVYDLNGRLMAGRVQAFDWSNHPMAHYVLLLRISGRVVWVEKI